MDLGLSEEQDGLVASFRQLLSKESTPERVRAAEPTGFDPALWALLVDTGVVTMAVAEDRGGWGASMLDLALVAEELGRSLAPAPVIEVQVAARLLAACAAQDEDPTPVQPPPGSSGVIGEGSSAAELLGRVLAEGRIVSLAWRPADGRLLDTVPAGAVCDEVLAFDGTTLSASALFPDQRRVVANLGASPLADLRIDEPGTILSWGEGAAALVESALDEWLTLTAAAVVGVADRAVELACEYAVERVAFGVPIGTFQAMSHPLADAVTSLDGARLLARKAAWALDRQDPRARELAAMAFSFATRAAEAATYHALHVHGGYGFMLEYDVQLHHRRARAWGRVWGDSDAALRRASAVRYGSRGGARGLRVE